MILDVEEKVALALATAMSMDLWCDKIAAEALIKIFVPTCSQKVADRVNHTSNEPIKMHYLDSFFARSRANLRDILVCLWYEKFRKPVFVFRV